MQDVITTTDADVSIGTIHEWIKADLDKVNTIIQARLESKIPLIEQICQHIIESGGKRLRPTVVLLAARACGYQGDTHLELGAIVEMLHTATLLHDDVVDSAEMRRGRPSANMEWGNIPSILVGDFLYSRIFQMMTELNRMPILSLLSNTTNQMAEGEMLQLLNRNEPSTEESSYMQVIRYKTAELFAAAASLGAIIADQPENITHAMFAYGRDLGIAFQLIDDALDYDATTQNTGKQIGNDLAEGKVTLPLIHALNHAKPAERQTIEEAIRTGTAENFEGILNTIHTTEAIAYTKNVAKRHATLATQHLTILPNSPYKEALKQLTTFATQRIY